MRGRDDDVGSASGHQRVGRLGDRPGGVDHVVDQDAAPALDLTDDPVGHDLVGPVDVAGLVDERQRSAAQTLGPLLGHLDPAGVRRDDGQLLPAVLLLDVLREDRQRHEVVDRAVEVPLDLVRVQVD